MDLDSESAETICGEDMRSLRTAVSGCLEGGIGS